MEEWEKAYRAQLDKEIKPGLYKTGVGKFQGFTDKQGYIDYLVTLKKQIKQKHGKS